jgi:hypothetical protein
MKRFLRFIAIALIPWLCSALGAFALDVTPDKFEEKLKTYDPAAVQAAREYAKTVGMVDMMQKSIPQMRAGLTTQVKAKNPRIDENQLNLFFDAFFKSAFVENGPVLERATLLLVLDTLSKDEIVALNKFYSSPIGRSVLVKMPQFMGRMPEVIQVMQEYVLPRALERAKAEMQKAGIEMKL